MYFPYSISNIMFNALFFLYFMPSFQVRIKFNGWIFVWRVFKLHVLKYCRCRLMDCKTFCRISFVEHKTAEFEVKKWINEFISIPTIWISWFIYLSEAEEIMPELFIMCILIYLYEPCIIYTFKMWNTFITFFNNVVINTFNK